jgi:hypothetical protein
VSLVTSSSIHVLDVCLSLSVYGGGFASSLLDRL